MKAKPFTDSEINRMEELRSRGLSIRAIAAVMGRNESSVGDKLRRVAVAEEGESAFQFDDEAFDRAEGLRS